MTLYVRPLVDPNGDPLTLYREGVSYTVGASVSTVAALDASAALSRFATAALSVSATVTAAATVTEPTDISSLIVPGSGSWAPGSLAVPGYDQAYTVTARNAALGVHTPGIGITLPTPSTPNAAHSLTIIFKPEDRTRRFYHFAFVSTFGFGDGVVVEPSSTIDDVTTLGYTWDATEHAWSVSSYSAGALVRDHSPSNVATYGMGLIMSPELRADGSFSTIADGLDRAMLAIPADTRAALGSLGCVADVVRVNQLFEAVSWRGTFDPSADSGISGRQTGRFAAAGATAGSTIEGRTMLHEIGHLMDTYWLTADGHPGGINPQSEPDDPFIETYYWDGLGPPLAARLFYTEEDGDLYRYEEYDESGELISTTDYMTFGTPGLLSSESEIVAIYTPYEDSGNYYRATITEWFAQACMLFWCQFTEDFMGASERSSLIGSDIGGTTPYNAFVSYMQGIGAFPT